MVTGESHFHSSWVARGAMGNQRRIVDPHSRMVTYCHQAADPVNGHIHASEEGRRSPGLGRGSPVQARTLANRGAYLRFSQYGYGSGSTFCGSATPRAFAAW